MSTGSAPAFELARARTYKNLNSLNVTVDDGSKIIHAFSDVVLHVQHFLIQRRVEGSAPQLHRKSQLLLLLLLLPLLLILLILLILLLLLARLNCTEEANYYYYYYYFHYY